MWGMGDIFWIFAPWNHWCCFSHFLIHACDELSPEPLSARSDQFLLHIPIRRHQRQSLGISISHANFSYQAGKAGACRLQNTGFMRFSLDPDSHLRHRSRPLFSQAPKLKLTLEAKEHFRGRIMFSFHSTFHVVGKSELRNVYTQNFAVSNIPRYR